MGDETFNRFHEILFWPLELSAKQSLDPGTVEEWIALNSGGKPWRLIDPYDRGTTQSSELRYAEFLYFHPFVRRFLYPSETDAQHLRILGRDDVRGVQVRLGSGSFDGNLRVNRVHLYLFQTHVAILVVEVESAEPLSRVAAMALLEEFRKVYAPSWEKGKSVKCPERVQWLDEGGKPLGPPSTFLEFDLQRKRVETASWRRPPVSAHWSWLLSGLSASCPSEERKKGCLYFDQIEDERIPAMSFLTTAEPHQISPGDLQRLCFYDEATEKSSSSTYSPLFLKDFAERHCYDRYWDDKNPDNLCMSTRYLCSGYGFTILGCANSDFVNNEDSGLLAFFRHHYFQLGLIAHFHRASLLQFSRRFSESVQRETERDEGLNRDFARFVTGYWFNEVSNQMQGSELFQFWTSHLGNQKLLEHVMSEKRLVVELDEANKVKEDGKRVKDLTQTLAILTSMLVPLTLAAVVVAWADMDFTRYHLNWLKEGWFWWVFGVGLAALVVLWSAVTWPKEKKDEP